MTDNDTDLIRKARHSATTMQENVDEIRRLYTREHDMVSMMELASTAIKVANDIDDNVVGFTIYYYGKSTTDGESMWILDETVIEYSDENGSTVTVPVNYYSDTIIENSSWFNFFDLDTIAHPLMRYLPDRFGEGQPQDLDRPFDELINDRRGAVYLPVGSCRTWLKLMTVNED